MNRRDDLVARRRSQGYSQEELAERLGADRCTVARWERGTTTPQPWHRPRLARILALPLEELDRILTTSRTEPQSRTECVSCQDPGSIVEAPWSPAGAAQVLHELAGGMMNRRGFLVASGGTLTGLATGWAGSLENAAEPDTLDGRAGRLTPEVIDRFDSRLAELRRLDDAMGGTQLRRLAVAEFQMLTRLTPDATESTYQRLFSVIAEAARICGWLHFDTGEHAAAQSYYIAALRASATADDLPAGANILAGMSWQATLTGHHHEAVTLVDSALDRLDRNACPRLDALLASRQARAHAAAGDAAACGRALNEAEARLDTATSADTQPGWLYYFDEAELAAQAGSCWMELGQPDRARPFINTALRTLDADYVRDRAIYHARSAETYLLHSELEFACDEMGTAIDLARRTGSQHCVSTIRHARTQMRVHDSEPRVIELDRRLATLAA
jgi:tetratricopeptide (TPR) repeat protein/DNA-binding XRE family transcriptional regulator